MSNAAQAAGRTMELSTLYLLGSYLWLGLGQQPSHLLLLPDPQQGVTNDPSKDTVTPRALKAETEKGR